MLCALQKSTQAHLCCSSRNTLRMGHTPKRTHGPCCLCGHWDHEQSDCIQLYQLCSLSAGRGSCTAPLVWQQSLHVARWWEGGGKRRGRGGEEEGERRGRGGEGRGGGSRLHCILKQMAMCHFFCSYLVSLGNPGRCKVVEFAYCSINCIIIEC